MQVSPSTKKPLLGISGHAGVGHTHSHCGFVQDDSAGFAVAIEILKLAFPLQTKIASVSVAEDTETITVTTQSGGKGSAHARRGFTPYEISKLQDAIGKDAAYSQATAFSIFGRIYGQGVLEAPVAFQAACCLAVMDSFLKEYPHEISSGKEDMPNKIGGCIGATLLIEGYPVSVMALVNASENGLGPDEDLEGNIMLGDKGRVMRELGLDRIPTLLLESKAYTPAVCNELRTEHMWLRINDQYDNQYVFDAVHHGLKETRIPHICNRKAYPRHTDELTAATQKLGDRIANLGHKFAKADSAAQKVQLMGELALLCSQDAGGVTFMSSSLHNDVSGGGLLPGMGAVLSMLVPPTYINKWKVPSFTPQDARDYMRVIEASVPELAQNASQAQAQLEERFSFQAEKYSSLLAKTAKS